MTQPVSVEKQIIDIDFSGGLNEDPRPEGLDWTKYLKVADNVDFGDSGAMTVRSGLYNVADEEDYNAVGSYQVQPYRLLSTGNGVACIGQGASYMGLYQFDESATVGQGSRSKWSPKGRVPCYSLSSRKIGSVPCTGSREPKLVGTGSTAEYDVVVVTPNGYNYIVFFTDKASGNIVRSYNVEPGTGCGSVCVLGTRYVHLYAGYSGGCKLYQFDSQNLPDAVPSAVTLTSGSYVVGAVATSSTTSAVVMSNGNISKCGVTPSETGTGSVAGFAANELHDVATDGTSLFIVGLDGTPRGLMKVVTISSLATSRTVTDTDAAYSAAVFAVGVDTSSNCLITAHYSTAIGSYTMPCTTVLYCSSGATIFTTRQALPCFGQVTSPFWNATLAKFQTVLVDLPQVGLGAGHSQSLVGGACVVVDLGSQGISNTDGSSNTNGYHVEAVLDSYVEHVGNNSVTKGSLFLNGTSCSQKMFTSDSGRNVTVGGINKLGANAYGSELRKLKLFDYSNTVCATDFLSGGVSSLYDGVCLYAPSCFSTPAVTALGASSGSAVSAGIYNYVVVFETVDAVGRRVISKCSNPFALTLSTADTINVTMSFPKVSDFYHARAIASGSTAGLDFRWALYRTTNGGTQYYKVTQGSASAVAASTAVVTTTDSTADSALEALPLLHRQPGTIGTPLDRYYAPASSCVVRHKDRVFVARGSDVYYSSFDVGGEAPWFNPAFTFNVPGGLGDITALGSMDGTLVIFKKNAIFVVDGDGPPENGGNGTEFSPPRKVLCEVGCVDARTLQSTNVGLMFRSSRGIELLNRKFQIDFIGKRVFRTVDAYPLVGGSAYDPVTGRCVWIVGSSSPGTNTNPYLITAGYGYAVVYDTLTSTWSRYKLLANSGYGYAFQDVCFAEVGSAILSIPSAGRFAWIDSDKLYLEYGTADYVTASTFIPIQLETGWVKASSKQERIRISDFIIAAYRNADCTVAVSYATDYSPSYTSVKTWTPSTTGSLTIVQLETQPPKESVQSMSFKIVTSDPTPTSFGAGSQMDIFGLSVRIGLKGGGVKLPVAQKG